MASAREEEEELPPATMRMRNGPYKGDVSALCLLPAPWDRPSPFLLAGTGPQLFLYDLGSFEILLSHHIFSGVRMHGIAAKRQSSSFWDVCEDSGVFTIIAVHGERIVKLYKVMVEKDCTKVENPIKIHLNLHHSLPRFGHWVLDLQFLETCFADEFRSGSLIAIGTSDNSVSLWDVQFGTFIYHIQCAEKCLLYSLRLWSNDVLALMIAAGTIFNEILIWKPGIQSSSSLHGKQCTSDKHLNKRMTEDAVPVLQRLRGHEGSIFRITWSQSGKQLVSVSDDRSVRIWNVERLHCDTVCIASTDEVALAPAFYGHTARIWDCYVGDKFLITVSEDCTSRIWTMDGQQLVKIDAHTGRGIWRCEYDPSNYILVTAGADSSIKVHSLFKWVGKLSATDNDCTCIPGTRADMEAFCMHLQGEDLCCKGTVTLDSKSEYVRCLSLASPVCLYVATNQGFLRCANFTHADQSFWTEIYHSGNCAPILCMDVLRLECSPFKIDGDDAIEDWIVLGEGKGTVTVICGCWVNGSFQAKSFCSWEAEEERKVLGVFWSKALGPSHVFTADPCGNLRMWSLSDGHSKSCDTIKHFSALGSVPLMPSGNSILFIQYKSPFTARVVCLDTHPNEEILICGDQRGNIVVFPLPSLVTSNASSGPLEFWPLVTFKGAHGISTVASISIRKTGKRQHVKVCSTGRDGYICNLLLEKAIGSLICQSVEKVPALTVIERCASYDGIGSRSPTRMIVAGFTAVDFIVWDLQNNSEVTRVSCGGWRRPHSYVLGEFPEVQHCFVFVKDRVIHVHRRWLTCSSDTSTASMLLMANCKLYISSVMLQSQFHGRELHTVQFIPTINGYIGQDDISSISWVATGSEDGAVRILRLNQEALEYFDLSVVLGEHVGGSAVRAISLVSGHFWCTEHPKRMDQELLEKDSQYILISVGAKEVMTCWFLEWEEELDREGKSTTIITSRWLNTRLHHQRSMSMKSKIDAESLTEENKERQREMSTKLQQLEEDDHRFLAVTAFSVRCEKTRAVTCFAVTASSNAIVSLHACQISSGQWVDIALLDYHTVPVLTLEHLVVPSCSSSTGYYSNMYLVVSGATDGIIALWDVTQVVMDFIHTNMANEYAILRRPPTGRGSQGGRQRWRSSSMQLNSQVSHMHDSEEETREVQGATVWQNSSSSDESQLDHMTREMGEFKGQCESVILSNLNRYDNCMTSSPVDCESTTLFTNKIVQNVSETVNTDDTVKDLSLAKTAKHDHLYTSQKPYSGNEHPIKVLMPEEVISAAHQSGVNSLSVSTLKTAEANDQKGSMWMVVSGGDDQALHVASFALIQSCSVQASGRPKLVCIHKNKVLSAHSSAIKGVWTDGEFIFSTGLDQRLRCWIINTSNKGVYLSERCQSVINVPEPAALHVECFKWLHYRIAVVGRGLQIIDVGG